MLIIKLQIFTKKSRTRKKRSYKKWRHTIQMTNDRSITMKTGKMERKVKIKGFTHRLLG